MTRRGRLVAAALICSAPLLSVPLARAQTTPSPAPGVSLPVEVQLLRMAPYAPQPGGTLRIVGQLRNTSPNVVAGLTLVLDASRSKIGSRGQFDDYAATPDGAPPPDATAVATADLARPALQPGQSERFRISVAVNSLQLPQDWQVYELGLVASSRGDLGTTVVGQLRTFLPYAPVGVNGVGAPVRAAWVWPLVDRPHRTDDTTWADDTLATELAPAGRLGALLAAGATAERQHRPPPPVRRRSKHGKHRRPAPPAPPAPPRPPLDPVPVTWAVDPLLVDDATQMAAGYTVGTGSGAHPGAGKAAARTWLAGLRPAVGMGEVLALPYADPDVTAASRSGLADDVRIATTTGQTLLQRALGITPLAYSWPPDGYIDQRALDSLFQAGVTTVVLDSAALPVVGGEPSETPGARTTAPSRFGTLSALLVDDGLASVVQDGVVAPDRAALDVQRLMSELLMIQAEYPSDQRDLVLAAPRRWTPTPAYAAALLSATGKVPWVQPITLSQVADGPAYTKVHRGRLTFPASERDLELGRGYLSSVSAIKRLTDAFAAILPPGDVHARAFDSGVLRLMSSGWRADPATAATYAAALRDRVLATMSKVSIASAPRSVVTLTSHSGTVPITVTNNLDSAVRIEVRIKALQLAVKGGAVTRLIPAHRSVPVDVRATATTSGVFPLTVSLYTPTGKRYGAAVPLYVRSTAYGATALLITGGATALLLLTVAARLVRRARAARRTARSEA